MEKLTKGVIKSIVKECLVEILSEGINANARSSSSNTKKSYRTKTKNTTENIQKQKPNQKSKSNQRILESAKNLTDDPVLNELLVDTAQTTLRDQVAADSKAPNALMSVASMPGADSSAVIAENSNPEDLFGKEVAGNWAHLAFDG